MTKYLVLIFFLYATCQKENKEIYSQPAKIRYTGVEIPPLEKYVVTDPTTCSYKKISHNPYTSSKAKLSKDIIFVNIVD